MWKREIFLQLDVMKWKGRRNVHSGGNGECLVHLKSEYQTSSSVTGASAYLSRSDTALKWRHVQPGCTAHLELLSPWHIGRSPQTCQRKNLGTRLQGTHSWTRRQSWITACLFLCDGRCCNMTSLWPTWLLLLRVMCCKGSASASIQSGIHDTSFAPCVIQAGLQARGRLLIV